MRFGLQHFFFVCPGNICDILLLRGCVQWHICLTPGAVEAASKHCHAGEHGLVASLSGRHTRGIVPEGPTHNLQWADSIKSSVIHYICSILTCRVILSYNYFYKLSRSLSQSPRQNKCYTQLSFLFSILSYLIPKVPEKVPPAGNDHICTLKVVMLFWCFVSKWFYREIILVFNAQILRNIQNW